MSPILCFNSSFKKKKKKNNAKYGRKISLEPQSSIILLGISGTGRRPNPQGFAQSYPSLGQVLIRQGYEASLPDVGLSKTLRIRPMPRAANSEENNT